MADLRDLGLSEYEARAYRALLETGPATAKELSAASDVPMGRVYDVLNSLERHRLARSQAASRPKKYLAVEPDAALDRLLADRRRELEEEAEQYEQVVEELSAELEPGEPVDEQFWTAAVGADDTADLLLERLAAADDRVVMIAATPTSGLDIGAVGERVAEELEAALERGVSVSLLLSDDLPATLPASVGERYADRMAAHPEFEVRTTPRLRGTFTLVDDNEVCMEVPSPVDPDESFAMIDLTDPDFASDARETVRRRWEESEPLSF
ncbi:TrmB family transcriptional regulator [Candidatus Halobonum tyrrellensis]|uniref:Transcriptional regulator n=1 Tax=Candidatus Halobonum tyrrellensis G22 TaxID=1324957 RepID=V4HCE0_9EURY|nr:helix-turn-helix domain-containing protein [Candidatus Halobonum tyrrellensis]ESP88340.1 transcriptional regulator [Candidatus Halobonum tyrrellensis G22]